MVGSTIEIDLAALRHNFSQVRKLVGQTTAILGVVKSDAYGHGMVAVARELETQGVEYLGVSTCREGVPLRQSGLTTPILLLLGMEEEEITDVIKHDLTPVLFRGDIAEAISSAALAASTQIPVHVKIDTGMGRLGVPHVEAFRYKAMPARGFEQAGDGQAAARLVLTEPCAVQRLDGLRRRRVHPLRSRVIVVMA